MKKEEIIQQSRDAETTLRYGVDAFTRLFDSENHELFFKNIYLPNEEIEKQLIERLKANRVSPIISSAGAGKTTLLHAILREYEKLYLLPIILLDFKIVYFNEVHSGLSSYLLHLARSATSKWTEQLNTKGMKPFNSTRYSTLDLALELVHKDYVDICSQNCQPIISDLLELQKRSSVGIRDQIEEIRNSDHHAFIEYSSKVYNLEKQMDIKDICFSINSFSKKLRKQQDIHHPIIAFDNIDAIADLGTQKNLQDWLNEVAPSLEKLTSIIYAQRSTTDFIATKYFQGRGGIFYSSVTFFPKDDQIETYNSSKQDYNFFDENSDVYYDKGLSEQELKTISWDKQILQKRFSFLEHKKGFSHGAYSCLSRAISEILAIRPVNVELSMQAGQNRRILIGSVIDFIEYISSELGIDFDDIGGVNTDAAKAQSKEEKIIRRGSAIKSLFYKMLGNPNSLGGNNTTKISEGLIDPLFLVNELTWKGNAIHPDDISKVESQSLQLLLLFAVNNIATNNVLLKEVFESVGEFGFQRNAIESSFKKLIKESYFSNKPYFELEDFNKIVLHDLTPTDGLNVLRTTRTKQICSESLFMYNYVCERIRQLELRSAATSAVENPSLLCRGLVDPSVSDRLTMWLCRLLTCELLILDKFNRKNSSSMGNSALRAYGRLLTPRIDEPGIKSLITARMVENAISFLSHHLRSVLLPSEYSLQSNYKALINDLFKLQLSITNIGIQVAAGRPHGVPRGEAINLDKYVKDWNLKPRTWT